MQRFCANAKRMKYFLQENHARGFFEKLYPKNYPDKNSKNLDSRLPFKNEYAQE